MFRGGWSRCKPQVAGVTAKSQRILAPIATMAPGPRARTQGKVQRKSGCDDSCLVPSVIKHFWLENPRTKWSFIAGKII